MTVATSNLVRARKILKDVWGYDDFRKGQGDIIASLVAGEDTLAVLPTGAGKSVCFQIPALLSDGTTVVISPLIALMKDQVDDLNAIGIPAAFINSTQDDTEQQEVLIDFTSGAYKLLYVAPERLRNKAFREAMSGAMINLLAVDEAHAHRQGSAITTTRGVKPAERVQVGDVLPGVDHTTGRVATVTVHRVRKRPLRVGEGVDIYVSTGTLRVTCDHPVFVVGVGYVPAASVQPGDEVITNADLSNVQTDVFVGAACSFVASEVANEPRMFVQMPTAVPVERDAVLKLFRTVAAKLEPSLLLRSVWACAAGRWFVAAHERGQSYEVARSTLESIQSAEATRRPVHRSDSGRKWAENAQTSGPCVEVVSETTPGTFGLYWREEERAPVVHQSRLRRPTTKEDRRSGRGFAQAAGCEEAGSQSRCAVRQSRVVRVARDQPRGADTTTGDEIADQSVFTFETDGAQTYFADGVLTHNCVSQWGHDFRPAYQRIRDVVAEMDAAGNRPTILACTATCPTGLEDDVAKGIGMREDYTRVVADPIRPNFTYNVMHGNMWANVTGIVRRFDVATGRYLVYTTTRRAAEIIATKIEDELGKNVVAFYHAGLPSQDRETVQDQFKSGERPVVCATCAFGMGIDVPNIRAVLHCGVPGAIEDYTQEIGRGGRDGLPTTAWLLFDPKGLELRNQFIDSANPPFDFYGPVWDYLKLKTRPGEILSESGAVIADGIKDLAKHHDVFPDDDLLMRFNAHSVRSVMATMESKGMIIRRESKAGTHVQFTVAMMQKRDKLVDNQRLVADALWDSLADKFDVKGLNCVEDLVDVTKTAADCDLTYMPAKRAMLALQEKGYLVIAAKYNGKTTAVSPAMYKQNIDDLLTREGVEAKRQRALDRLDQMVGYVHLRSEKDRIDYLRAYFMGAPAQGDAGDERSLFDQNGDEG